jgi:excisionase family DNA binding protein
MAATGVTGRCSSDHLEPLVVSPRQACRLLNVGNTRLYQLIAAGEVESYREGRARRITTESIRRRVARLAASATASVEPARRRRGRPTKNSAMVPL